MSAQRQRTASRLQAARRPLPDIPPVHQTESKKILTLFNRALVSTSLREKNELLEDVEVLWLQQNEKAEKVFKGNMIKRDELAMMRGQQQKSNDERELLRANTQFFYTLKQRRPVHSIEELVKLIEEKEKEISTHDVVKFPTSLKDVTTCQCSEDELYFYLSDLNLRRAEELAYCYQKRLQAVERSQESEEIVMKEFGSIHAMIELTEKLMVENAELKKAEGNLRCQSFIRRWKMSESLSASPREMSVVLKTLLTREQGILDAFDEWKESETDEVVDFEEFIGDKMFGVAPSELDSSEFGNISELADMKKMSEVEKDEERLDIYKEVVASVERANAKIAGDFPAIERLGINVENAVTRVEKLTEENQRLLYRVQADARRLDELMDHNMEASNRVIAVINGHHHFSWFYMDLLKTLRRLTSSHISLTHQQARNQGLLQSLMHTFLSMGKTLQTDMDSVPEYVTKQFDEAFQSFIDLNPKEEVVERPPTPPKEPEVILDPMQLMRQRRQVRKKRRAHANNEEVDTFAEETEKRKARIQESLTKQSLAGLRMALMAEWTPPLKYRPIEIVTVMGFALKVGGFTIGVKRDYHALLRKFLLDLATDIEQEFRENMLGIGGHMASEFSRVNYCGNRILVKDKCDIEIQTDAKQKDEIECQTELSGPPVAKGKKK